MTSNVENIKETLVASYAMVTTTTAEAKKVNFRTLKLDVTVEYADIVIPRSSVEEVNERFQNTLYGYFIGKRVAYPVVENYVRNAWAKYGLTKVMMNARGFFFFKFSTKQGMDNVIENGPWIIRTVPIILKAWAPNVSLTKEDLTKVPVWVKLHEVPVAAYTGDRLSIIATEIGTPKMLDSYTSTMCNESWGRSSYARALIEVDSENELKETLIVAVPPLEGSVYVRETVKIEYEWRPPRCATCKVFGHTNDQCPKAPKKVAVDKKDDGFIEVTRKKNRGGVAVGKQKQKLEYRPVSKHNQQQASSSVNQFKVLTTVVGTEPVLQQLDPLQQESERRKGKASEVAGEDSDSEVEMIYDETINTTEPIKKTGASTPAEIVPDV